MGYRIAINKNKERLYAYIVEDYYNYQTKRSSIKCIKSYGDLVKLRALDPDVDDKIKADLEELKNREPVEQTIKVLLQSEPDVSQLMNYGVAFYRKIWELLKLDVWFDQYCRNHQIDFDYDLAVFYLVVMRIMYPGSRLKAYDKRDSFIFNFSTLKLTNLYDTLRLLAKAKNSVVSNLNGSIADIYTRCETIALYDVTTFYFESFTTDELKARGMSKENRTNETQVVLGLLIDAEGIPINYELFRGNTAETKTMLEVVNQYRTQHNLKKVTIVADRGLNSAFNLQELTENDFDYVVAQSISRLPSVLQKQVLDNNWQEQVEEFRIKTLVWENKRIIVTWSLKRQLHDLKVLEDIWQKGQGLLQGGDAAVEASFKHGARQFLKSKKRSFEANVKLYEKRKRQAGFYAITTSLQDCSAQNIYHTLHQLWRIEECFRVMKTDLEARPVFVWKPDQIRGHFLICYIALVIERLAHKIAENKTAVSDQKLIELMKGQNIARIQAAHKKAIYMRVSENPKDNTIADSIMSLLDIQPLALTELASDLRKKVHVRLPSSL